MGNSRGKQAIKLLLPARQNNRLYNATRLDHVDAVAPQIDILKILNKERYVVLAIPERPRVHLASVLDTGFVRCRGRDHPDINKGPSDKLERRVLIFPELQRDLLVVATSGKQNRLAPHVLLFFGGEGKQN